MTDWIVASEHIPADHGLIGDPSGVSYVHGRHGPPSLHGELPRHGFG